MKRQLLVTLSVVALSAVSHELLAAELETTYPLEKAPPAAERTAPAAERAAPAAERAAPAQRERAPARERQAERPPARERQAAPARRQAQPTQQSSAQPSQSSWTGSQVGGFGGGNAGGGGASDPPFVTSQGACNGTATAFIPGAVIPPPFPTTRTVPCVPGPGLHGNLPANTTAAAVASFDTPKFAVPLGIPMLFGGPRSDLLIGGVVDVSTGTRGSDVTQNNIYSTAFGTGLGPDLPGQTTTETIHVSFSERVSVGFRAKIGLPIFNYWAMPYITAGIAVAKTEASYSYTASNFAPGSCTPYAGCATTVSGAGSFNQTRSGFSGGGGVEVQTGIPGVKVAFDYTYTNLGSITGTIPLVTSNCAAMGGIACTNSADVVRFSNLHTQRATVGVKLGL
jgi:opacity protein-like surface antigen